jgi:hypothetical protein
MLSKSSPNFAEWHWLYEVILKGIDLNTLVEIGEDMNIIEIYLCVYIYART